MKNVVITGANRGIGLQLTRKYAAQLNKVYACCRSPNREMETVNGVQVIPDIDVTLPESLATLKHHLKGVDIDILINNAGILHVDSLPKVDAESLKLQFAVNSIAPLMLTQTLLDRITRPGGKIVMITSRMGSIADNSSGGYYGYRMSKVALNMASVSLAKDLRSDKISVAIIHPGFVATDMTQHQGMMPAADSARNIMQVIDEMTPDKSGQFFHCSGESLPW
ncbi:MAG: SDR family oxidoreductase [Myxococcales bacterium]|nr:SDR family oxidoreductase [Myxococcales bacterium]